MSYEIDRSDPPQEFLHARNAAGCRLQEQFKLLGGSAEPAKDYRWVKADLTWPSFDHLTFAYGNQIFSVLVDLVENGRSSLQPKEVERCSAACEENSLVPCVFPVDRATMQPIGGGWNLFRLADHLPVSPGDLATDEKIPMSEWELRNFTIQVVREHLTEKEGATVLSYTDVIGVDPQLWFEVRDGRRCWVVVRHLPVVEGEEWEDYVGFENENPQLRSFDGYFAPISLASSEAVMRDGEGQVIPLSERFSGKAPLYRGDGFHIKFEGLQRIHVS